MKLCSEVLFLLVLNSIISTGYSHWWQFIGQKVKKMFKHSSTQIMELGERKLLRS